MIYFVSAIILAFLLYLPKTDYYMPRWRIVSILGALSLSFLISQKTSITIGLLSSYIMCSAIYVGLATDKNNPGIKSVSCLYFCLRAFLLFSSCCLIFIIIPESFLSRLDIVAMLVLPVGIYTTIFYKHIPFKENGNGAFVYGFGGNPSINATLLSNFSMFLFLDFERFMWIKVVLLVFILFSIIKTKAAAGLAALCVGVLVFLGLNYSLDFFLLFLLAVPMGLIISKKTKFLSMSGRDKIWDIVRRTMITARPLYGLGCGSFYYFLPAVQMKEKLQINNALFPWAHNDFLQFLSDAGIVGFLILAFSMFDVVGMASANHAAMAFVACYFINSLINFPNHLAPDCLIATAWMRIIYQ